MYSNFQKYILEELDEDGDYCFILIIPYFLSNEKGIELNTKDTGIGEHEENYNISDNDFFQLKNEIIQLFNDFDLVLYKTKDDFYKIKSDKFLDSYDLLSSAETEKFLTEKENWIWRPNKPGYFIAEKEGSNKVGEYFNKENS